MLPLVFLLLQSAAPDSGKTVTIPRIEAQATIDGVLDELPWSSAARLSGFRQYMPVDGRPAEERTDVLVWYSPSAIHFGIVAYARDPGTIRATVADRDDIGRDDRVTIYLDTFDDQRRAFVFGVNPLGAQADGVHTEGAGAAGRMFGGGEDLSPDFHFDSRGTLTDSGYVVEVRIPFKSLRYPASDVQQWGLQIVREIPESGYEDTWTDVRRAGASFLAQAGRIEGMRDLERGMVTEIQPFVTAASSGLRSPIDGTFERDDTRFDGGANIRLGFTQFAIDATVNPDFSQVEADAGLVTVNERFPLFVSEKRPFFLEGIELFATPNQLVYTRRIVDPSVGGKITGKVGAWSIAHLTALDAAGGNDDVATVTRVRRDIAGNSTAGVTVTSRSDGNVFNHVAAADARIVFQRLYFVQAQLGGSWTGSDALETQASPIWSLEFDRTGRAWGFNYSVSGIGDEFDARLGFVPRRAVSSVHAFNRLSWYGARGALLESVTAFFGPTYYWRYGKIARESPIEGDENINVTARLRGGWELNASAGREFYDLDRNLYQFYNVERPDGTIEPYIAPERIEGLFMPTFGIETPTWQRANASFDVSLGEVPIFAEGSEGRELRTSLSVGLRPTPMIRVEGGAVFARIERERDGSEYSRVLIPRLRVEYQPLRSLFFRAIGEYRSERVAAPRDARTGDLLLLVDRPLEAQQGSDVRSEWLISYEPTPGTVAFVGYTSTHRSPLAERWAEFDRQADGFFVKVAYQFRR